MEPNFGDAVSIVLVNCRECGGTGNDREAIYQCEHCLGQRHVAVNRAPDGGVPDGETLWLEAELPEVPHNPLILSH